MALEETKIDSFTVLKLNTEKSVTFSNELYFENWKQTSLGKALEHKKQKHFLFYVVDNAQIPWREPPKTTVKTASHLWPSHAWFWIFYNVLLNKNWNRQVLEEL